MIFFWEIQLPLGIGHQFIRHQSKSMLDKLILHACFFHHAYMTNRSHRIPTKSQVCKIMPLYLFDSIKLTNLLLKKNLLFSSLVSAK